MPDSRQPTSLPGKPPAKTANARDESYYREALESALGVPFSDGNALEILQNGKEIFPAMLKAIRAARTSIDFVTYVYWRGDIAREFARALAEKAAQGCRVRVLLDAFGSKRMDKSLVDSLENAGVEVRYFRPLTSWRIWRTDKRTHRKILITDDQTGFTGGVGIAEEWTGDARGPNEWRDTHFSLIGPAVRGLKAAFLDNWNEAGDWAWDDRPSRPQQRDDGVPVQIVRASSEVGWSDTASLLRALVCVAVSRLTIITPYFVPDERLVRLLRDAENRGVDVQIMMPGKHCDMRLPQLAGQVSVASLLDAGVGFWRYQRTNLHSKIILVDGIVACIGSANLNHRSLGKDEECCGVVLSQAFARELEARFEDDCAHSERLDPQRWRRRGRFLKLKERLARMFVEQL